MKLSSRASSTPTPQRKLIELVNVFRTGATDLIFEAIHGSRSYAPICMIFFASIL